MGRGKNLSPDGVLDIPGTVQKSVCLEYGKQGQSAIRDEGRRLAEADHIGS